MEKHFLKPNVVIEPLFERWYAWSHLVSPATAAMNVTDRHLKIMNSYIQTPMLHEAAVKNPAMLGGPFMDFPDRSIDKVKSLRSETMANQASLIEFSTAVKKLDAILKEKAKGYSMEELYQEVPEILKGYVELVYDLNNNPSFRFFEALLYNSEFYCKDSQSIALWVTNNDERPFSLSTPKLDHPDVLHLKVPFDHIGIDKLSNMKRQGGTIDEIADILGVDVQDRACLIRFLQHKSILVTENMKVIVHACDIWDMHVSLLRQRIFLFSWIH